MRFAERLSARIQTCGKRAISCAIASAAARLSPVGTTSSHAPMRKHSSAGTLRPVMMISSALPCPTRRGSRTVPPSIKGTPQRRQ